MKSMKFLIPLAALALSGIAAAGLHGTNSIVVRFGDLNLDSPNGVASLHRRIRTAAKSVCGRLETTTIGLRTGYRMCVAGTIDDAVTKVNHEGLTNYHAAKG